MNQTTAATPTGTFAARPAAPIRLHRTPLSGHCHRVELFLSLRRAQELPKRIEAATLVRLAKALFAIEDGFNNTSFTHAFL